MNEAKVQRRSRAGGKVHLATKRVRELADISKRFEKRLQDFLRVNATDLVAMQHLIQRGPLTAGQLAKAIELSPGATTTVIDRLEALGHVQRMTDSSDRRVVTIVATDASRRKAEAMLWAMIGGIDQVVTDLPPDHQQIVLDYLDRVIARYRESSEGTTSDPSSD
jgi:DNA-binding MarR family transcriptional regulator